MIAVQSPRDDLLNNWLSHVAALRTLAARICGSDRPVAKGRPVAVDFTRSQHHVNAAPPTRADGSERLIRGLGAPSFGVRDHEMTSSFEGELEEGLVLFGDRVVLGMLHGRVRGCSFLEVTTKKPAEQVGQDYFRARLGDSAGTDQWWDHETWFPGKQGGDKAGKRSIILAHVRKNGIKLLPVNSSQCELHTRVK